MKIAFVCPSGLKFNVLTPDYEPLGGTESAICYLARELAKTHDVWLFSNNGQPEITFPVGRVMHVHINKGNEYLKDHEMDVFIVTSAPEVCAGLKVLHPNSRVILWNHMWPDQETMRSIKRPEIHSFIDHIVYVSETQKRAYTEQSSGTADSNVNPVAKIYGAVINNAISPHFENMFKEPADIIENKELRGAYTSTPFRGLNLLKNIRELEIDIYSSMKVYQGDDAPFQNLYDDLAHNGALKIRGSLPQPALAERLKHTAFLIYPCTFQECHSIAILEAMAAGVQVITTPLGMEDNTYATITYCVVGSENIKFFAGVVADRVRMYKAHPQEHAEFMMRQVRYINSKYTWAIKAKEWDKFLTQTVERKAA